MEIDLSSKALNLFRESTYKILRLSNLSEDECKEVLQMYWSTILSKSLDKYGIPIDRKYSLFNEIESMPRQEDVFYQGLTIEQVIQEYNDNSNNALLSLNDVINCIEKCHEEKNNAVSIKFDDTEITVKTEKIEKTEKDNVETVSLFKPFESSSREQKENSIESEKEIFQKCFETITASLNLNKGVRHAVLENWINLHLVPLYDKEKITEYTLDDLIAFAEVLDEIIPVTDKFSNSDISKLHMLLDGENMTSEALSVKAFLDVVENWLKENNTQIKFCNGDLVRVKRFSNNNPVVGVIVGLVDNFVVLDNIYMVKPLYRTGLWECYSIPESQLEKVPY